MGFRFGLFGDQFCNSINSSNVSADMGQCNVNNGVTNDAEQHKVFTVGHRHNKCSTAFAENNKLQAKINKT